MDHGISAATLLILRELMHQLQFAAIHYVDLPVQA